MAGFGSDWQLMQKMTSNGRKSRPFYLPSPTLCIYIASLNVSLQLFLFTILRTHIPRDSHFRTWVRAQANLVPAPLESFPSATWLYSAISVDSTLPSWTSSYLCTRDDHRAVGKEIKCSMVRGRVTAEAHTELAGTFNWEISSECTKWGVLPLTEGDWHNGHSLVTVSSEEMK